MKASDSHSSPALSEIVPKLLSWYVSGHRRLPWRETSDPYAIWLSEIMLQQTQVKTASAYYRAFLTRFPTVEALAVADEAQVLKVWEGLGYYRRARNLLAAAKVVAARGAWPKGAADLEELPGVGRSTAGAIASIAFGEPAPILDGNVKRVWSRIVAFRSVPAGKALEPLWRLSEAAVLLGPPGVINQALMELGATLCTRRRPLCDRCPVSAHCQAFLAGDPESYPKAKPRRVRPLVDVSVALLWKKGRFLVTRRPDGGFLGGLWELPGGKWEPGEDGQAALRRELREELGVEVTVEEAFAPIRHGYTHFEVRLHAFSCLLEGREEPATTLPHRWIPPSEVSSLAFPRGTLKVFERVLSGQRKAAETPGTWETPGTP